MVITASCSLTDESILFKSLCPKSICYKVKITEAKCIKHIIIRHDILSMYRNIVFVATIEMLPRSCESLSWCNDAVQQEITLTSLI